MAAIDGCISMMCRNGDGSPSLELDIDIPRGHRGLEDVVLSLLFEAYEISRDDPVSWAHDPASNMPHVCHSLTEHGKSYPL